MTDGGGDDGPSTRASRAYHWTIDHLAKFPGRVTIVTFAAGLLVTVVVVLCGGDDSPATVVGLVATLWALFFAVMIYLLTARDTDRVLDQIADLHEQLAAALESPETESPAPDESTATVEVPETPDTGPAQRTPRPDSAHADRHPGSPSAPAPFGQARHQGHPSPRIVVGASAIAEAVPSELLDAWTSSTGLAPGVLTRAWTRDPRSERQWVVETETGERWVVFSRGAGGTGVISLSEVDQRRGRRQPRR